MIIIIIIYSFQLIFFLREYKKDYVINKPVIINLIITFLICIDSTNNFKDYFWGYIIDSKSYSWIFHQVDFLPGYAVFIVIVIFLILNFLNTVFSLAMVKLNYKYKRLFILLLPLTFIFTIIEDYIYLNIHQKELIKESPTVFTFFILARLLLFTVVFIIYNYTKVADLFIKKKNEYDSTHS